MVVITNIHLVAHVPAVENVNLFHGALDHHLVVQALLDQVGLRDHPGPGPILHHHGNSLGQQ